MKFFYSISRFLLVAVVLLTSVNILLSADYYAVTNGNWNAAATWASSCGGAGGFGVPGAGDDAYICAGITVVVNASSSVNDLFLQGGTINFSTNGRTLTVNNDFVVSNTNAIIGNGATRVLNISGSLIVSSGASLSIAGETVNVTGNVLVDGTLVMSNTTGTKTFSSNMILGTGGTVSFTATETIDLAGNLITNSGSSITGTATGVINVGGNLQVLSGGTTTMGRLTMTVSGTTSVSGKLELNVNTGVKTFGEKVTVNSGGEWLSTTVTTVTNLVFQNGIENNGDSFSAGASTFNSNDQEISGDTELSFSSAVTIAGAITVTNKISDGITITGALNGNNAASTWENDINTILYYGNAAAPMATGVLSASASPNTVYYDLNGTQTVKGATYDNLILSSGGTKTLNAAATVNDDFIINSGVSFNPAGLNFIVIDTTLIYGNFADGTAAGTSNLQYVELVGGTINGGQTGVVNILGDFDITNGDGTIGRVALTVTGTTTIGSGRTLTLNSNTGVKTFIETLVNDGTWVSTAVTTATNLVLQNGIKNNGDSFTAGACTFSTNGQEISGDTELSFSSAVTIAGAISVTNKISDGITITGVLNGNNAASTWENDINSVLYYRNATVPMATGVLSVDASPNIVYYDLNGAQAVKGATYDNLILSSGGTKTLTVVTTVNDDFIINSGVSFNPAGNDFTVSDTTLIYGTFADGTAAGTTNLQYTELNGGTINGGRTGIVNILGDLDITNGDGTIGQVALTVSGITTIGSGRTLTLNSNTGVKTFGAIENNGTWVSTIITTAANLVLQNGIENNGDSFTAGACTFSTNNQEISGDTELSFSSAVTIAGAITVTNKISNGITMTGALTGDNAASTWENDINTILYYGNAAAPMATGVLSADASPNTVYYDLNGAQAVKGAIYDNLILSSGGAKTLNAEATVNDDFIINAGVSFNPTSYNFTVSDTTIIYGTFADANTTGTTNLQYVELIGGVINGGADGIVNILGDFDVINGDGIIGRVWLTVNGTTTIESGRSLTLNNNIGIRTFAGVLENYGTWVSTTIITPANLVFQNGIENNGDSFTAGAITFDVNNQELRGSTSFMFTGAVYLASGIELTNNATVAITSTSVGALGGATWIQAENSTLNYSGQTITVFSLDATATGNTISYNRAGAQTVFNTVSGKYFNLNFATSNTKTLSANIDIEGDLSISDNAVFSVGTYDINIAGNWNNSSNAADPFTEGTRTVTFDGTSAQTIYNTGDADGTGFYNFTIDNTFPDEALTLNARVNIAGTLNLQEGHIVTDATNILALGTNASVSISASPDESFVKGPMINTYNVSASAVTKIFPIGQGNKMHRTDLTIRQTNTTATEYTADFIYSGADDLGFDLPGTIDKVSEVDQWIISNGGASNVNTASVTLFYNGEDVVDDPSNLRVVKDDGAGNWIDLGGSGSASTEGEITTSVNFTDMGIFTLANAKDGNNPLPIELLSFDANVKNDYVITEWTTASEINNDYFTVERSTNAQDFEIVEIISGAGNSNQVINYSLTDVNPYSGISYYRLKQTDFDGVYSYSNIIAVNIVSKNELTLTAWQNGSNLFLSLISDIIGQLKIEIFDCTGKLVLQKSDFIENNESIIQLDKSGFMPGMYIIRLTLGSSQKSVKVFIN